MRRGRSIPERRVKGPLGGLEVDVLDELTGFAGAGLAVHAAVFPFDRQGAAVPGLIERADDFFEPHASAAHTAEVPPAALVAERQMARQNSRAAVQRHAGVLHVHVVNAVWEEADELG